jgi:hypothetical protein
MQGGKRKLTAWNIFVGKVFREGKAKNKDYSFKQALSDASERKSEMKSMKPDMNPVNKSRKNFKKSRGRNMASLAGGKSRKHGKSRKNRKSRKH